MIEQVDTKRKSINKERERKKEKIYREGRKRKSYKV